MDDKELQELVEQSKGADLGTLISVKEAARRAVLTEATPAHLLALERATKMLHDATTKKGPSFKSRMDVLRHLQARGLKIQQSKLYKDCERGLLKVETNGTVFEASVESYVNHPLAKLLSPPDDQADDYQRERAKAETKRAIAQAEHWELRTKIAKGQYIEYVQYEQDLAARITILKSDMENYVRSSTGEIIQCVGGDPAKTVDLIDMMLARFRSWLARYAENREFVVPAPRIEYDDTEEEQ